MVILNSVDARKLDCKTVRIFAYSSTREQSNKRSGMRLKTALRACEARALGARKTLTPRFTDFFTDFEKKNRLFCSLRVNIYLVRSGKHIIIKLLTTNALNWIRK